MKIEKRDSSAEKRIVIAMIVDAVVLGKIASKWEKDLFKAKWSNLVGGWCVKFYEQYGKAPGKAIQGLFESWAEEGKDKETTELVDRFLSGLSDQYKTLRQESNSEYIIDLAKKHFDKVKAVRLAEHIQGDVDGGDIEKALKRINSFSNIEMGGGAGVDLFNDKAGLFKSFESQNDPLITYPGDLGTHFFKDALSRDKLIAFMGPEKRGKTWWLMDMAWRALINRRKVAFFEVGDMSEDEIRLRFGMRAARKPLFPDTVNYPTLIEAGYPVARIESTEKVFTDGLSKKEAWDGFQRFVKTKLRSDQTYFRLFVYPNDSISIGGIKSVVKGLEKSGWVPDVIIIDYADIIAPMNGTADTRDQINSTWKQMKALSQIYHCLVLTATQSDAGSYSTYTMQMDNFSEDKRKYAHVNGMIGLNATEEESELGIMRLNWMVLRGGRFNRRRCIHVAGCLALGNPAVKSAW